jgi:putative aldouronate transport system permease protein
MRNFEETRWQILSHAIMVILTACAVLPFVLLVIASLTDNQWAVVHGFNFFPGKWSLAAYQYLIGSFQMIGRAYLMTILATAVGTTLSISVTSMFAYALSDPELPGGRLLNFLCLFTMLFGGGIVASYFVWNQVFHIRDTFLALIFPNLMMNAFMVILVKNYFTHSIPSAIKDAARIDGASEFRIFAQIIIPLSKPILATIGLMTGLAYWNDWTNGLYYLTLRNGAKYYTVQLVLNQINQNLSYLTQNASQFAGVDITSLPSTTVRMAIAAVAIIPILVLYPFLQKYFVKGIIIGAVKG